MTLRVPAASSRSSRGPLECLSGLQRTEAYDDLAALVPGSAESAPVVREIEKE